MRIFVLRHGIAEPREAGKPDAARKLTTDGREKLGRVLELYFGGDMEASIALSGQVAGRIERVKPVAEILRETLDEFFEVAERMGKIAVG